MAKTGSGDRQRYWQELIQRQQVSGQSIESFCIKEKLSQTSFYAWKRRLRESRSGAARTTARRSLVPVQIVNDRLASAVNLEVQWSDGILLRVQGCEARMVKAVVATILAFSKRRGQPC
jgi:transposase-like protein